ncbi:MAG: hypothetical protein RLZZ516_490 [Cyanobacteriota bacterium]
MAHPFPESAVAALLALALVGCGEVGDVARPAAAPPPQASAEDPGRTAATPASPSLTPLTTPEQVIGSLPIGRPDPFAPITQTAAPSAAAAAALPAGLRFTGVIGSGGGARAFVQIGAASGVLCLGPRGRCADGAADQLLLPPGWSVSTIDATSGRLTLRLGAQRRVLALQS